MIRKAKPKYIKQVALTVTCFISVYGEFDIHYFKFDKRNPRWHLYNPHTNDYMWQAMERLSQEYYRDILDVLSELQYKIKLTDDYVNAVRFISNDITDNPDKTISSNPIHRVHLMMKKYITWPDSNGIDDIKLDENSTGNDKNVQEITKRLDVIIDKLQNIDDNRGFIGSTKSDIRFLKQYFKINK